LLVADAYEDSGIKVGSCKEKHLGLEALWMYVGGCLSVRVFMGSKGANMDVGACRGGFC